MSEDKQTRQDLNPPAVERKFVCPDLNYSWSWPELWGTMRLFKCIDSKRHWNNIDCGNGKLPVNPELAWDLLFQLDPCKSMGHDRIQLKTQRAGWSPQGLSMIFEQSWECGEVPVELASVFPIFKKDDPGNYRSFSLTSGPSEGALQRGLDKWEGWQTAALQQRSTKTPRAVGTLLGITNIIKKLSH